MKRLMYMLALVVFAGLLVQCGSTEEITKDDQTTEPTFDPNKRPGWVDRLPYVENANIMEAVGVADPNPIFTEKRRLAINNSYSIMVKQMGGLIKTFSDDYTRNYRDYYKDQSLGGALNEAEIIIALENEIRRNQVAAWWEDPKTGRYWVYLFMPLAGIDETILEEVARKDELILEFQREKFRERMEQELEKKNNEREEQLKDWKTEFDKKMKEE